jgi:hypothetical protein
MVVGISRCLSLLEKIYIVLVFYVKKLYSTGQIFEYKGIVCGRLNITPH